MVVVCVILFHFLCLAVEGYLETDLFNDLKSNSPQQIWHSYTFDSGIGNREELIILKVAPDRNIELPKNVFKWKNLQSQGETIVVGLGPNFILVSPFNNKNNVEIFKEEIEGTTKFLCVFQKWEANVQSLQSYVVVGVSTKENNEVLKWYKLKDKQLKFLEDWPFHQNITYLEVVKISHEHKLIIVSQERSSNEDSAISIYNFKVVPRLDLWLFEKIHLSEIPSSLTVFSDNDNTFMAVSLQHLGVVDVLRYSKVLCLQSGQKHFNLHQKIFVPDARSVVSFRVGFFWNIAVASENSTVYKMGEDLMFSPVKYLNLGIQNEFKTVPVNTYREDVILLSSSDSRISALLWNGNEIYEFIQNFSELVCRNDSDCTETINGLKLKDTTTFPFNNHQNILISGKEGKPLLVKLLVKLRPISDKLSSTLNELINFKTYIKESYSAQAKELEILQAISDDITREQEDDAFSISQNRSTTIQRIKKINTASQTKDWSDTLTSLNILKSRLDDLKATIDNFTEDALNVVFSSNQSDTAKNDVLPENISDGIVFDGKIIIDNLNVSVLNGYDMKDILENSYRKDRPRKVDGTKFFQSLNVDNLIFENVNGIMGCDMVFSDDPWEGGNSNVLHGDVLWESKLNILQDFTLIPGEKKDHVSSTKNYETFSNIPKYTFDELHFQDLEISNESIVLKSINTRPMILPVHPAPFDMHYLDMVNQARIEIVNVLGNLTIGQVNGKNFSDLMQQIIFKKNYDSKLYDSIKLEGVLRVQTLEPENLNSIPVKPKQNSTKSRSSLDNSSSKSPGETGTNNENLLLSSEKTNIYIFQDLEIEGKLLTQSLNNLNWKKLNNTLKKSDPAVVTGVKTFTKPLKVSNLDVTNINDENLIDKIMTDYSEQTIKFPQKFKSVNFKNLILNGTWDGIDINKLNESLLRPGWDNGGHLTVEDGSALFVQNLYVTDTVNEFPLSHWDNQTKKNISIYSANRLKNVKALKVFVEGSLDTNNNINGINLTNLNKMRVSITQDQIVEKDINQSNLTVNCNLFVNKLNGNDVTSIVDAEADPNIIDHFLNGQTRKITKLLVKGNIRTVEGINSYNLSKLSQCGIHLKKGNHINGTIIFEDIANFKEINITNTINGISLKKLSQDVVLKYYHVPLNGTKTFSTINVLKDIKTKSLNGHLMQDVVTLMGDHSMKGPVKINGNVVVRANMTLTGNLNDVPVSRLLKTFSTEFDSYVFVDDLYLESEMVTIKNLQVRGLIQNVSFDDLMNNVVYKSHCCNITGRKTFLGPVKFKGNLKVEDSINDLNLDGFAADIVLVTEPAKISGTLTISEAILNSLYVHKSFNSSLINGFDLNEWFEESISLNGRDVISGKMTFENPIIMNNIEADLINGHLSSAVITLKGKQFIPVLGLFQRLNVTSDVSVGGNVNGINLPEEYEKSVLLRENQTINSKMIFHNDFVIKGNLYVDQINEKPIADLITLHTEQTIYSDLDFLGNVVVRGNIDNLKFINGIDLKDWYQRSVFLNRPQEIYGFWKTKGNVKAKAILGNAVFNDVNLSSVSKEVENNKLMAIQKKEEMEMEYYSSCHELEEISRDLNKLPYLFQQFDIAHVIETQSVIESVIPLKIAGSDHVVISFFNECFSAIYAWDKENLTFNYLTHVNIGPITKWLVTYRNNSTFLISSFMYTNIKCEENRLPGNIWVFNENSSKYVHLLTGNAFVDIVQENETAEHYFTLEENGHIYQWTIKNDDDIEDVFLVNVGSGGYKFIDFNILGGLAIFNGREIKEIKLVDRKIVLNYFSLLYGNIVALPVNGRVLVGVVLRDKIIVYENIKEEKVFSVIHAYRVGSVLWFNYGFNRQSFLIVSSHHKLIEIFEYESVSGFVKRMSLQLFSVKLQAISLPIVGKHQLGKFIAVVQKNKVIFLKADMLGDLYEESDSFC